MQLTSACDGRQTPSWKNVSKDLQTGRIVFQANLGVQEADMRLVETDSAGKKTGLPSSLVQAALGPQS